MCCLVVWNKFNKVYRSLGECIASNFKVKKWVEKTSSLQFAAALQNVQQLQLLDVKSETSMV
jgi:hypothetical protein